MAKLRNKKFVEDLYLLYLEGKSLRKLERKAGRSYVAIKSAFDRFGLKLRERRRPAKLVTKKLVRITSFEDAYWLGFCCGDSYIDKRRFSFYLKKQDYDHVILLRDYFGIKANIKQNPTTKCYGFSFSSVLWYPEVSKHGLVYLKRNRFIPSLKSELMNYFWLGLFDADGGIMRREHRLCFTGPKVYVDGFRQWLGLYRRGGTELAGTYSPRGKHTFEVKINRKSDVLATLSKLYDDSEIHLPRKYDLYRERYC